MNREEKEKFLKDKKNYGMWEIGDTIFYGRTGIAYEGQYRIYIARELGDIPDDIHEHFARPCREEHYLERKGWVGNNADYGHSDAIGASRIVGNKRDGYVLELYINAILRRPFTEEQRKRYEKLFYPVSERPFRIYNSANDKERNQG